MELRNKTKNEFFAPPHYSKFNWFHETYETQTGITLERVRWVRPHPLKSDYGCAAPILTSTLLQEFAYSKVPKDYFVIFYNINGVKVDF